MLRRDGLLALAALALNPLARAAALGVQPRPLRFPADFGAHPDTHIEWWYLTGALSTDSPNTPAFGFQLTFFRVRTAVSEQHPSRFAARQLLMAHAALTDLGAGKLRHDQMVARAGFGIAEAAEADTDVRLQTWRLRRHGVPYAGSYRAEMASERAHFALALDLRTTQPVLLQGQAGYSRKGPSVGAASHYYSEPQLAVQGQLTLDGRAQPVQGKAWLDHEWSNQVLGDGAVGWDWAGINLADGGALTVFRLRRADGSVSYAGGSYRAPGQTTRDFAPGEVRLQPGRHWTSPRTGGIYPVSWRLSTPAGEFELTALLDDQELDARNSTGTVYWEGLSVLNDPAGRRLGTGYLEMTGYAGVLKLG